MEKILNKNIKENNSCLLKPKIDVVFHSLFREDNKHLLESLISDILKSKVKVKTIYKNKFLEIDTNKENLDIMNLKAELEGGEPCLIQVILLPQENEKKQIVYYWSQLYFRQEEKELNKTISIAILDHEIEELKGIDKLGIKWNLRNDGNKSILTDKLEMVIIEIPKAIREYQKNQEEKISQWMMFLDNPNKYEISEIINSNEEIKEVKEELEKISKDEELRVRAELREKEILNKKELL